MEAERERGRNIELCNYKAFVMSTALSSLEPTLL